MNRRGSLIAAFGLLASLVPLTLSQAQPVAATPGGGYVAMGVPLSPPANLSTSGDFATDMFGDPWDFSNIEDVPPIKGVGVFYSDSASIENGVLTAITRNADQIRLLMDWSKIAPGMNYPVLPWGRDGWAHPIDAAKYSQVDFQIRADSTLDMAVRWTNAAGDQGVVPFRVLGGGWQTFHFDMNDRSLYIFAGSDAVWSGPITRMELFRAPSGGNPAVPVQLDYFRVHTPTSSRVPTPSIPVAQVLSPNETGGADYATVERGNPWDFVGLDDVLEGNQVANLSTASGDLTGTTTGNDSFIELPLGNRLVPDRYHRFTADVCYGGGFSLENTPGGGMNGRIIWMPHATGQWIETQDFVIYPGCQTISIDLASSPAWSINDETVNATGWRGLRIDRLRFDLDEDPGQRPFTLKNIKLADDAAFSTSYPITFNDASGTGGTKADLYVSTSRGDYNGTQIAGNLDVVGGVNTYNWNGNTAEGAPMPNGTYWVYAVMHNSAGTGVGYSTGPVRIEKPVSASPSYFVPLTPSRLLDTRNGVGGNIFPIDEDTYTELPVTGVGGVPLAGVTAVVMNVTATNPTGSGYITAWPSGEARPTVSNINFVPGQTVPNLVTVKVGANGRVNLYNSAGTTDLIADVAGYYTTIPPASGGRFTAVTPSRLLDTRNGTGTGGSMASLGLNEQINLSVTGTGGVPSTGVTAVALNVTVDQPTGTGYLTVWPAGEPRPTASTHNYVPGLTVANLVLAKVGANGQVSIYNSAGNTHVVADVIGYFSGSGGLFVPVVPQRLIDSRTNSGMAPMAASSAQSVTMNTGSPVPAAAKAVVVNVTSVDSTSTGYVTVWPSGAQMPLASTLNPRPGVAVPNQAYLRTGGGKLDAFNANGTTNLIVDVFGYIVES